MKTCRNACWVLFVSMSSAFAAEPTQVEGKVESVTVYRGQALVTRLADLVGPAGLREVVITNLPDHVQPSSIYAESADGVEVRSVRYRVRPASQDVREDVRQLDEKIQDVQQKLQANAAGQQVVKDQRAYLAKLENFVAPTATEELHRGVLNAETLKSLSLFLAEQRQASSDQELTLGREQQKLQADLDLYQRQRQQLTANSARNVREAVVFVNLQKAEGSRVRLRYLVDNATWSPSYNLRATGDREKVTVEYHASVQQMSGEDWTDVNMTLSTATPSLVATPPTLTALTISLQAGGGPEQAAGAGAPGSYKTQKRRLEEQKQQIESTRNQAQQPAQPAPPGSGPGRDTVAGAIPNPLAPGDDLDVRLNWLAGEMQVLDFLTEERVMRLAEGKAKSKTEGISVAYQMAGRTSLPSRSDQQLIQIASVSMPGDFHKLATPVLTQYVYNEASVTNAWKMVLLAGPYSAYVDGEFVGQGEIPTVATGESFTAGFGIDSSLRATRELVEKTESIQGGNRVVELTYSLAIENFGASPADVRLLDRMATARESEVKLTRVSTTQEPTSQPSTSQKDRKGGILRWDVKVPESAIGASALHIEYKLRLEYDKQMRITTVPLAAAK